MVLALTIKHIVIICFGSKEIDLVVWQEICFVICVKINNMTNEPKKDLKESAENKAAIVQPDPETLKTTDPQEHMEGPISSLMKKASEGFDKNTTKEEADETKEKGM